MRQKHNGKPAVFVLISLLVFLCVIPAVSHAAQSSGTLPDPTCSYEVAPGTVVSDLRNIFELSSDMKLLVRKADGSIRASGPVETGDRAVVTDSSGELFDCIAITVKGRPAPSSAASSRDSPGSSAPGSSNVPVPVSSGNSSQSSPEASSAQPVSSSSTASEIDPVFSDSVPVASLAAVFGDEAGRVSVFTPDGAKRESGLVCTGDVIVLQDGSGNTLRTVTATVLGDLTRCGTVTENGCSLLYGYLTGRDSLSADLLSAADMNRDGKVDTADLLKMKIKLRDTVPSRASSVG